MKILITVGVIILTLAVIVLIVNMRDIIRYLRIRSM